MLPYRLTEKNNREGIILIDEQGGLEELKDYMQNWSEKDVVSP